MLSAEKPRVKTLADSRATGVNRPVALASALTAYYMGRTPVERDPC